MSGDVWAAGDAYEKYVGRWSRKVAEQFLTWLDLPGGSRSLDVGSGTGALTSLLAKVGPSEGVDASEGFVAHARELAPGIPFSVALATELPFPDDSFDAAVSGLVLNFVPDQPRMVAELARVVRRAGTVGLYVWDYAEGMELLRRFWDAALAVDEGAPDEAARFPVCAPSPLAALFEEAGLREVETRAIDVPTTFVDFEDYWSPFLGGQGPAPAYLAGLPDESRAEIRRRLHTELGDGPIRLTARAWAVRGLV